jgi:hypothetical protein
VRSVLALMPAAERGALLTGLEAFCAAATARTHGDVREVDGRTA